ncbi:MAG TPA: 50S ribosomal protein L11 methyltransferase [Chitinophagaceae bacterium]|nr:50S ribosomal protein L11 methyltransferase [Chitinophagaceae bacterium]
MNVYIQVAIGHVSTQQSEILIALMSEAGYEGFVEEERVLTAFIREQEFDEEVLISILKPYPLNFTKARLEEKNWNEEWEKNFEPVIVDNFCAVRASFHQPISKVQHEIIITPKMSFGTGHHATTYMMMKSMRGIDFKNKSVLDFGTGTGVLAILAEKLGATRILAIDNDEWSINNGRENIEENSCSNISIVLKDNLTEIGKFDIILANINRNVLLDNMEPMAAAMESDGLLLLSGFYEEDVEMLVHEAAKFGLTLVNTLTKNKWRCILLAKMH